MSYQRICEKYKNVIEKVHEMKTVLMDENKVENITVKGAADFVTKVDFTIESKMKEALKEWYPQVHFISEEQKNETFDATKSYWILDPVDGTTNLIHHYQHSAVSLGLYEEGRIIFGIVYNPFTEETFLGALGEGAYLNGEQIHVSLCDNIERSLINIGSAPYHKDKADKNFEIYKSVYLECTDLRISGSSALDVCFVAAGRLEAFFEWELKPWDYAASSCILTEAGGKISSWNGDMIPFSKNTALVASNGLLHDKILTYLHV
ncbi:MAG: inositol monophosphatase family protein [Eubacteriales bacterium]